MSVLPLMELINKIADMWIDWPLIGIACWRFESDLGRSMQLTWAEVQPMTPEVTITDLYII